MFAQTRRTLVAASTTPAGRPAGQVARSFGETIAHTMILKCDDQIKSRPGQRNPGPAALPDRQPPLEYYANQYDWPAAARPPKHLAG